MSAETQISVIEALLEEVLQAEPSLFKVHIRIKPTNNVKVYIDGDNGVSIDTCVKINRKLYAAIEEKVIYPEGEFSLEVSSPGIDEPLILNRQYTKNIGRNVEILFNDATKTEGKLLEVTESDILVETTSGKGKKAVVQQVLIPFANIKSTTVQIQF
jgi:ribosome maturation factor RimP